ncbi:hypothetical protein ERO13_A12G070300v2 [Gossypium hirsutum]|uniref:Uncharacterized protein n=4 Tax=Gossypium TaxID=3633 RepID=A0A2P5YRL1_GOSBA|nr:hypothetical protein ES319_A12G072300v1 [Gossypium barbadense]KAG4169188.1 hypothetical protein ERO13_A12G070300v2 [Gossypium hirsutum]TYG89165.1 hypothetical protein ES288_A12G077800v1 [Gossypium darwinii]TYH95024.1 hypothetical protein ES332_A12G079100v1 [Gossypium tomentosum]TYJ04147.1 hypothetical protein E1A91_A12G074400v1 [Gossypium mustelinum]
MAQNNLLSILVLLSLVLFLEIEGILGRHLILEQNQKVRTFNRILAKESRNIVDPKINGVNKTKSPPSPPTVVIGASPPKNDQDFRRTSPGHSPGIGHSIQN